MASKGLTARIESLSPRGLWLIAASASGVAVVIVAGIASSILQGSRWWTGGGPVLLALAVSVVAPIIGLWPLGASDPADNQRISRAAYAGTPIRMMVAVLLSLLVLLVLESRADRIAFGVWLAGLYLVSLLTETVVLAVWLRGRDAGRRV